MLKKLVKYDLKWINKLMVVYFVIAVIFSLLTRLTSLWTTSFAGNLLYQILRGFTISAYASCLITCAMRIWVRFRNNTYKDESYLTHTLPVENKTMYNSKIVSSLLSILLTLIVIIICFGIAFLNKDIINFLKETFSNKDFVFITISLLITFILEMVYMINCGLIGILLGHRSNNKRTAKSIIFGLLLYFLMQAIILVIIYAIGLFSTDIKVMFDTVFNIDMVPSMKKLLIIVDSIYFIFIIGMYFIGKMIYNKGVDVD